MSTATTRRIRVNVTAQDIAKGEPCAPAACPIARALTRHGLRGHAVHSSWISAPGWDGDVPMPRQAESFIRDFDSLEEVQPFAFYLTVPA